MLNNMCNFYLADILGFFICALFFRETALHLVACVGKWGNGVKGVFLEHKGEVERKESEM